MLLRAFATMFVAGSLAGQPTPGSIVVTHSALIYGPSVADSAGDIYATVEGGATPGGFLGTGSSTAVATPGAAQTQGGGGLCPAPPFGGPVPCTDAFVAKTDPSGNIVWATFLGGPTSDYASAIAIDSSGNVYVAGETGGSFPTTAGAAIASSTTSQTFAAKLSADGSKFLYVTYLPSAMATVNAISVDAEGNAYIVGDTAGSTQAPERVYAVKLSADGSTFAYSATLGGSSGDSGTSVTGDATGHAFVTGWTRSKDFPVTAGVVQPQFAGAQSAFVTELDAAGNIVASTLLGGSGLDAGGQILLDSNRNVYVVGTTTSPDFPITSGAFETAPAVQAWQDSLSESFAVKLLLDLSGAVYATYFPSSGGGMIALGSQGDLYVGGGYAPPGLPLTASAPLRCPSGGYLAHLNASGTLVDGTYVSPSGGGMSGGLFALTPQSNGSLLEVSFDATEITLGGAGWIAPPCISVTAYNAATQNPASVVPGEFVTLYGWGIGPEDGVGVAPGQPGLGGVQVLFDGRSAPVLYAQSQQVNVQAPFELAGQTSTSVTLQYNGQTFGPLNVLITSMDPELFRIQPNITNQALAENQDGSLNGPSNPAAPGSVVTLWGMGYPPLSQACATGGVNPPGPVNLVSGYTAVMDNGGVVQYAGGAPGLACGVIQINMQVPATAAPGPLPVTPQVSFNNGNSYKQGTTASVIYVK